MIEVCTISFRPGDVPDLPELQKEEPEERHFTPEPADWRPIGDIW